MSKNNDIKRKFSKKIKTNGSTKMKKIVSYAIFCRSKEGELFSESEKSFRMVLSQKEARVHSHVPHNAPDSLKKKEMLIKGLNDRVKSYNLKNDGKKYFIVRLNSKNCPVKLDWIAYKKNGFKNIPWIEF